MTDNDMERLAMKAKAVRYASPTFPGRPTYTFWLSQLHDLVRLVQAADHTKQPLEMVAPAGWKLVPVEPTPEMLMAAQEADLDHGDHSDWMEVEGADVIRIHKVMLAAAPQQPAPQPPSNWREVLDRFAAKERGTAQAHIAAQLVDELTRAMDAQHPAPQPMPTPPNAYAGKERGAWEHGYRTAAALQQPAPQPLTDEQRRQEYIRWYQTCECQMTPEAIFDQAFKVAERAHGIGEQP